MVIKTSLTEELILGILAEQPHHGYQIEKLIVDRGMRKWTDVGFSSIYYVLEKLEKNELAAFGDGQNDIPMFESVGHIVVMENATDDVKKYADFITKSNNDDGVAYAIDKYIKNI